MGAKARQTLGVQEMVLGGVEAEGYRELSSGWRSGVSSVPCLLHGASGGGALRNLHPSMAPQGSITPVWVQTLQAEQGTG